MTPAQWLAAIKDIVIVLAVIGVIWWIYHAGGQKTVIQDDSAVIARLEANQAQQEKWQQQRDQADETRDQQMATISARIDAQRGPVILRVPASPGAVPAAPAAPGCPDPGAGGIDLRPRVNAFERKYEQALADCRAALASP